MAFEVMKSELDLFKKVSFQGSIENSQLIEYRPTNALTESSSIEFDIPTSSDEYLDLQNIYLRIKGKLVLQDGTNYQADQDDRYSLINYPLNTIFDQLSIYLSGTLISQSSKTYPYLAMIEALTQNSVATALTYQASAGFQSYFGENHDFDSIDGVSFAHVRRSKTFCFYGQLHDGIFRSDRLLLNGVQLHIILTRASSQFCTMGMPAAVAPALAATTPKVILSEASLFVRKVKLTPNLLNAHAKALQLTKAVYPIKRSVVKIFNLPAGQSTYMLDNIFMGQMPSKVIIGFITNDAFSGSYILNPFKFENQNLTFLCLHMNGETYPKSPYEPDFRNNFEQYTREYYDLFLNLGSTKNLIQPPINYLNYPKGQCLFAFNFNSDFEHPNENEYINIQKEGFLNIGCKFRVNLVGALKLICYAQFDNVIEIDENRNVTVDY